MTIPLLVILSLAIFAGLYQEHLAKKASKAVSEKHDDQATGGTDETTDHPPTPTSGGGAHGDSHDEPAKPWGFWGTVGRTALWVFALWVFMVVFLPLKEAYDQGITERERKRSPDGHEWVLWTKDPENVKWDGRGGGISRVTNPLNHSITLKWYSGKLDANVTASWIPGEKGAWSYLDGSGHFHTEEFTLNIVTHDVMKGFIVEEGVRKECWFRWASD